MEAVAVWPLRAATRTIGVVMPETSAHGWKDDSRSKSCLERTGSDIVMPVLSHAWCVTIPF
jgi:hypothetical protein